jgi:hypothetical protein
VKQGEDFGLGVIAECQGDFPPAGPITDYLGIRELLPDRGEYLDRGNVGGINGDWFAGHMPPPPGK